MTCKNLPKRENRKTSFADLMDYIDAGDEVDKSALKS